jgi:hypothetical protein
MLDTGLKHDCHLLQLSLISNADQLKMASMRAGYEFVSVHMPNHRTHIYSYLMARTSKLLT